MVLTENVSKVYDTGKVKVDALRGVSTQIADGEFTAIAGPSGSGKTTLLNLIGCLDSITGGSILIDKVNIAGLDRAGKNKIRQQKIGFIFQSYNLIPVLTAQENVELALSLLDSYSKKDISELSHRVLTEVGLDGMQNRKPNELSGGQQQRVSIARALVKKPSVILADEPTANLDSKTGTLILDLMLELNKKHGTTFIFSTHDEKVMSYTRRIIRLADGLICGDETQSGAQATADNVQKKGQESLC